MWKSFKKIVVVLPVLILTVLFFRAHEEYGHTTEKRFGALIVSILLFYMCIIFGVVRRKQNSFFQVITQASFYAYVFMVLTLTGYFILFKEISSHDWWHKMMVRVEHRDHVNLKPFEILRIYKITDRQVVGNFVMLLPLGIYLPLMYRWIRGFLPAAFFSLLASVSIELLQLITSYRSADIDDVILNTLGACVGFIIYKIFRSLIKEPVPPLPGNSAMQHNKYPLSY